MSSLNELYVGGEYSDLTIVSRTKNYQVHRAIVCPRSEYFASASRKVSATTGSVHLAEEDDPLAVDMIFHYMYHLDYPSTTTSTTTTAPAALIPVEEHQAHGHTNGVTVNGDGPHPKTNGHTGPINDIAPFSFPDTASEPKDEPMLVDAALDDDAGLKKEKEKKKKRKKKAKVAGEETKDDPVEEPEDHHLGPSNAVLSDDSLLNAKPMAKPTPTTASSPSILVTTKPHLVTHARVYALSKKYKIDGLKALALEKFEGQVHQSWASEDFLQAAKVVYESTMEDDVDIRNAVTTTLYQHPELLDKKETQDVIKGLALGFDLLMRVRSLGGFGT